MRDADRRRDDVPARPPDPASGRGSTACRSPTARRARRSRSCASRTRPRTCCTTCGCRLEPGLEGASRRTTARSCVVDDRRRHCVRDVQRRRDGVGHADPSPPPRDALPEQLVLGTPALRPLELGRSSSAPAPRRRPLAAPLGVGLGEPLDAGLDLLGGHARVRQAQCATAALEHEVVPLTNCDAAARPPRRTARRHRCRREGRPTGSSRRRARRSARRGDARASASRRASAARSRSASRTVSIERSMRARAAELVDDRPGDHVRRDVGAGRALRPRVRSARRDRPGSRRGSPGRPSLRTTTRRRRAVAESIESIVGSVSPREAQRDVGVVLEDREPVLASELEQPLALGAPRACSRPGCGSWG